MNQILVTEKLYVTPEIRRRKKMYKVNFIISIIIIIGLVSFYIYTEYDKSKNEEISQGLLTEMTERTEMAQKAEEEEQEELENTWQITISSREEENVKTNNTTNTTNTTNSTTTNTTSSQTANVGTYKASNGKIYETVGTINIPTINVSYPILSKTTTSLLKVSVCKFFGPEPNEIGNLCIAGHNYKTDQFFSKVLKLVVGDVIEITDLSGRTLKYSVYDKYNVVPEDTSCTSQNTNNKRIVTLITCTNDNKKRVIVHAKEIT